MINSERLDLEAQLECQIWETWVALLIYLKLFLMALGGKIHREEEHKEEVLNKEMT